MSRVPGLDTCPPGDLCSSCGHSYTKCVDEAIVPVIRRCLVCVTEWEANRLTCDPRTILFIHNSEYGTQNQFRRCAEQDHQTSQTNLEPDWTAFEENNRTRTN